MKSDRRIHTMLTTCVLKFTGEPTRAAAVLKYDESDPFAVTVTVANTPWTFARELLAGGDGWGLVKVFHEGMGSATVVQLTTGEGSANIVLSTRDVAEFLEETYNLVPAGHEAYDIDDWIERCR